MEFEEFKKNLGDKQFVATFGKLSIVLTKCMCKKCNNYVVVIVLNKDNNVTVGSYETLAEAFINLRNVYMLNGWEM